MKLLGRQQPDTELDIQQVRAPPLRRAGVGTGRRALGAERPCPGPHPGGVGQATGATLAGSGGEGVVTGSVEIIRFPQVLLPENLRKLWVGA